MKLKELIEKFGDRDISIEQFEAALLAVLPTKKELYPEGSAVYILKDGIVAQTNWENDSEVLHDTAKLGLISDDQEELEEFHRYLTISHEINTMKKEMGDSPERENPDAEKVYMYCVIEDRRIELAVCDKSVSSEFLFESVANAEKVIAAIGEERILRDYFRMKF